MAPYVNIYLTDRAYGGASEGGWWYQTGEAIRSIPASHMRDAERALRLAKRICDRANGQRRSDIESVLSEGRFDAVIVQRPAQSYPETRPRYE